MPALDIYCILCPSFHGATLLSLVLGNHSRVLSLGDTVATNPHLHCGCGELVSHCAFWQQVGEVQPRPELIAAPALNQVATVSCAIAAYKVERNVRFEPFASGVDHQLVVCREFAKFDVFIDGFKSLSRYTALKAAGFPVHGVLHLIRDPRSFAASSKRKRVPADRAGSEWAKMHAAIARVTRLMGERVIEIRYEDLCAAPEAQLARLQSWMRLEPEALLHPFPPGGHWVGNTSMRTFDGRISLRESWRETLSADEIAQIEKVCGRQARKLGYELSLT
jgi:hypothetical protein